METLTDAMTRLRAAGYTLDLQATESGRVRCAACGTEHDPATMTIDEIVRFEGESDPGDEAILVAMRCDCGEAGLYTSAFGAAASPADTEVLAHLPQI